MIHKEQNCKNEASVNNYCTKNSVVYDADSSCKENIITIVI